VSADDKSYFGMGFTCGAFITLVIVLLFHWLSPYTVRRQEAVDHGAAEWVVDNQGHVEFKWKDGK
jgi:hypothetical protein